MWQPDAAERAALRESVDARWQRFFPAGELRPRTTSRELVALLLDAAAAGADEPRLRKTLEALRSLQDADPQSRTHGNFHWYAGDTKLVDRNGVEFTLRHAGLLWMLYRDSLPTSVREPMQAMLQLAATGITRHPVQVSYTNIYLMKAWNLVALGESLPDAKLAAEGQDMLRRWLAYTAANGITEYLSPTYYGVDLENLALIANTSGDATTRKLAHQGLVVVWQDAALHWHASARRMGGTHSRDYNRLAGVGDINALALQAGWPSSPWGRREIGPYAAHAFAAPDAEASALLQSPLPRLMVSRWGERAEQTHTHWLGRSLSIASSDAAYGTTDTASLAVSLAGADDDTPPPVITWFMDGRRDYYANQRIIEAGSGHPKALHLKPFVASVQREREVLVAMSGTQDKTDNVALESVLTLPADAEYWLDDRKLDLFTHRSAWLPQPAPDGRGTHMDIREQDGRATVMLQDDDSAQGLGLARVLPAKAGDTLRIAATLGGGPVSLYLNFLDTAGRVIERERMQGVPASEAVRTVQFTQQAPAGTHSVRAWLYSPIAARGRVTLSELRVDRLAADGQPAQQLAGFDFRAHRAQHIGIRPDATLVLRLQDAAVALRPLGAWRGDGKAVPFSLHNDGLSVQALRLTATHAEGATSDRGTTLLWAWGAEGMRDDAAFARFRAAVRARRADVAFDGRLLQGRVGEMDSKGGEGAPLVLRVDVQRGERLLREGMSPLPAGSPRSVNGVALPLPAGDGR
ncbi:hypothetical protein [Uliginosibacterium sp. H1]|uniref:hypothetical protein n=1 Tax=Uliginosibacterium sp. H1 TaxID=3114757 RepID=UPI002E19E935|nr:hypothetical protein [Uliginosibacterium sp. H1]